MSFADLHDRIVHALDQVQGLRLSARAIDPGSTPAGNATGSYSFEYQVVSAPSSERSRERYRAHATIAINWVRAVDPSDHLATQRAILQDTDRIQDVLMGRDSDWMRPLAVMFENGPGIRLAPSREWMFARLVFSAEFYMEL